MMVILQLSAKTWDLGPRTLKSKMTNSYALQPKYKLNQQYSRREIQCSLDFVCLFAQENEMTLYASKFRYH